VQARIARNRGSLLVDWSTAASLMAAAVMFVPGVRTFVHESQRSAVVNELQLEVRRALQVANQLGQPVTLCATAPRGNRCAEDSSDWSAGWTAFVDEDDDGRMNESESSQLLWQTQNSHPHIAVEAYPAAFSFRPRHASAGLRDNTAGEITVRDRQMSGGHRTIRIPRSGLPRLAPQPEAQRSAPRSPAPAVAWILLITAAVVAWWQWPCARLGTGATAIPAQRARAEPANAPLDRASFCRDVAALLRADLGREPARQDLRLRLLEVHFAAHQVEEFVEGAREYRARSRGACDPLWPEVVAMGARLAPGHAIFRQELARCA
jgi:Tfp pilus assembly protein FimT